MTLLIWENYEREIQRQKARIVEEKVLQQQFMRVEDKENVQPSARGSRSPFVRSARANKMQRRSVSSWVNESCASKK